MIKCTDKSTIDEITTELNDTVGELNIYITDNDLSNETSIKYIMNTVHKIKELSELRGMIRAYEAIQSENNSRKCESCNNVNSDMCEYLKRIAGALNEISRKFPLR